MKRNALQLALILCASPAMLIAQTTSTTASLSAPANPSNTDTSSTAIAPSNHAKTYTLRPFSRVALGAGMSAMGINLQAATDINRHLNARATGNYFNYSVNNISTNGFSASAKLNMATAGASLDFYPFPMHGFRLSPGVLFYNQNMLSGNLTVNGGQSFKLNHDTYYSSIANPVQGTASVGLNANNPAFTMTTGWGNMISRRGGHVSFPFELGVAVIGAPTVNMALAGKVCNSDGVTDCQNVTTDSALNTDLQAQIAKYKSDLNVLQVYPILSFGLSFNFGIRGGGENQVAVQRGGTSPAASGQN